jgi:hypothetical protein
MFGTVSGLIFDKLAEFAYGIGLKIFKKIIWQM